MLRFAGMVALLTIAIVGEAAACEMSPTAMSTPSTPVVTAQGGTSGPTTPTPQSSQPGG